MAERAAVRRLLAAARSGNGQVAAGTCVLAGGSYAHLALAGRALDPHQLAALSTAWALVFSLGIGVFFPVEQELTRALSARRARGAGTRPAALRGAAAAAVLLAAAVLAAVLAAPLTGGGPVLPCALAGLAVAHTGRGILAGLGLLRRYAAGLAVDGVLRIVLPAALWAAGCTSALPFGLVLAAAPIAATAAVVRPGRLTPGPPADGGELRRGFGPLLAASVLAQGLANAPVVGARILAPTDAVLVSGLLCALVLVRVPQFLVTSLQAGLLAALTSCHARGDTAAARRILGRAAALVLAAGTGWAALCTAAGPWAAGALFAVARPAGRTEYALLGAGTVGYLLAFVLANGVIARARQRAQGAAWAAAAAVLAGCAALLPSALPAGVRVTGGYAAACWTAAAVLAAALLAPGPARYGAEPRGSAREAHGAHEGSAA